MFPAAAFVDLVQFHDLNLTHGRFHVADGCLAAGRESTLVIFLDGLPAEGTEMLRAAEPALSFRRRLPVRHEVVFADACVDVQGADAPFLGPLRMFGGE